MKNIISTVLTLGTLLSTAGAQNQASTIARLTDTADVISKVRVLAVNGRDSARITVVFRGTTSLLGKAPGTFELSEPGWRTCGRALYGMVPGSSYLAFLKHEAGTVRLKMPSARCLIGLSPELLDHVRALSRSKTGASRIAILAKALSSAQQRIREDAALACTTTPYLAKADATVRAQLNDALRTALAIEGKTAPSLMVAAARLHLTEALDSLLPTYLAGKSPRLQRAMLNVIPQIDSQAVAKRLAAAVPSDNGGRMRAMHVLARLSVAEARPTYMALLRGSSFDVTTAVGHVLLRAGMPPAELAQLTNKEVAEAAKGRLISEQPRFRVVLQGETRR